jgi:hypothetical protein
LARISRYSNTHTGYSVKKIRSRNDRDHPDMLKSFKSSTRGIFYALVIYLHVSIYFHYLRMFYDKLTKLKVLSYVLLKNHFYYNVYSGFIHASPTVTRADLIA